MLKRRLNEPFGKAGVAIGVIALVFAMLGGAYAATGGGGGKQIATASKKKHKKKKKSSAPLNGKQKKEVKKISKAEAKKFATAGPAGPVGPIGPKGDTGLSGANGNNGENGGRGEKGDAGSPWTAGGTLPSGSTENGTWTAGPNNTGGAVTFPIPLPTELGAEAVHLVGADGEELNMGSPVGPPTKCEGGSASEPKAAPGNICVYVDHVPGGTPYFLMNSGIVDEHGEPVPGVGKAGGYLVVIGATANGWGTYAVTAP